MKELFYYIHFNTGMKMNGSFTRDKSQWITFDKADVDRIGDKKPYGATRQGVFISCDKY